jgi:hypothetical protein
VKRGQRAPISEHQNGDDAVAEGDTAEPSFRRGSVVNVAWRR